MKVLFAVNNENISESIVKKYGQEYKEIISAKNVYYFNAIVKELQRDKSYDRIVVSEDLQPFSNNNYDAIDKFIFDRMDNISDEATNQSGKDIPIILICTDRRAKSEPLLVKLFGIGVYDALIGKDRSITNVCELLHHPRTKKEAKVYYHIDVEDVDYKPENEGDVSEVEIQNILNHYKKLGRNEEKYVESFDHIASQYTDAQLRLISQFLPINVKAVLEAKSPKYQQVVSFASPMSRNMGVASQQTPSASQENDGFDLIERNLSRTQMKDPVVIPSGINTSKIRKMEETAQIPKTPKIEPEQVSELDDILDEIPTPMSNNSEMSVPDIQEPETTLAETETLNTETLAPKRRGRPKKVVEAPQVNTAPAQEVKRGRGRPKKVTTVNEQEKVVEPEEVAPIMPEVEDTISQTSSSEPSINLFELGEEDEAPSTTMKPNMPNTAPQENSTILPGLDFVEDEPIPTPTSNPQPMQSQAVEQTQPNIMANQNTNSLISKDKKIVAFVGTSKNGTSFIVNHVAEILSQKGINTAILDLTKNKNAYYIYTENEEELRKIAYNCIDGLLQGTAQGIPVHKNLTVYTTLPEETNQFDNYTTILQTLSQNYSVVLLDCDFETNYGYFAEAQELYLVQSMDILTIQPLTAFLRNLKAKNVLNPEKIRIILNKVVRIKGVTEKTIVGGMAFYNDPAMSFMTELFNKDNVPYCSVPFDEQAYTQYLEGLVDCKVSLRGYPKNFTAIIEKIASTVYPLINNGKGPTTYNNYSANNTFPNSMNNTLNRMKSNF